MISTGDGRGQAWALRSRNVCTPEGVRPAAVIVHGEHIAAVVGYDDVGPGIPVENVDERWVLPGLVDTHVHINEPGRTEWEGFETATKAAAAGGITTLIDMPLNSSPVTTTVAALQQKRDAANGKLWVDVGFHGGVVPGNAGDIQPLIDEGVCAFKAFLCPSGIDEFPNATEEDLRAAMPILAKAGLPLFVHAELISPLPAGIEAEFAANPRSYRAYLATRPEKWEEDAIRLLFDLGREFQCHVHVVHLSAAARVWQHIWFLKDQVFTLEACPHYLYFAAEEIPDRDPRFKCAPPIRERKGAQFLQGMVIAGWIETIGSDHSPAPPEMKHLADGDLRAAWGGIASLQLLLPVVWTTLVAGCEVLAREVLARQVLEALTLRPANLVGLGQRKGKLAAGLDADIIVFDPDAKFTVDAAKLFHRHKSTPYDGRHLQGVVEATYLRGRKVFDRGDFSGSPCGQTLRR